MPQDPQLPSWGSSPFAYHILHHPVLAPKLPGLCPRTWPSDFRLSYGSFTSFDLGTVMASTQRPSALATVPPPASSLTGLMT